MTRLPVFDAWLEDDDPHVWIEHPCADGELERTMLPYPQWRASDSGRVNPSVICTKCKAHQFVDVSLSRRYTMERE